MAPDAVTFVGMGLVILIILLAMGHYFSDESEDGW